MQDTLFGQVGEKGIDLDELEFILSVASLPTFVGHRFPPE